MNDKKCEPQAPMKSPGDSHPALRKGLEGFACIFVPVSVGWIGGSHFSAREALRGKG